jgi:type II secretion system protein J
MTTRVSKISSGFTLIEAILALAVCAVVLVAINSVFFGALRLRAKTADAINESLPIERALSLLRRDLQNAVPPGAVLAGPLQSGVISGGVTMSGSEDSSIQIYTSTGTLSADAPWGDIQKVTYQLQAPANQSATGKDLVRSVTRNLLPTTTEDLDEQYLASGIDNLQFSYFDGVNWLDTWDALSQTNLPQAIRVSLYLSADAGSPHPQPLQLLVPLMAQTRTNLTTTTEVQNGG